MLVTLVLSLPSGSATTAETRESAREFGGKIGMHTHVKGRLAPEHCQYLDATYTHVLVAEEYDIGADTP